MNSKIILASLAMDLKRVAMGYYRGSEKMANRFWQEALRRRDEIDVTEVKDYLRILLEKFPEIKNHEREKFAEDALMYSTLFQNAALKS